MSTDVPAGGTGPSPESGQAGSTDEKSSLARWWAKEAIVPLSIAAIAICSSVVSCHSAQSANQSAQKIATEASQAQLTQAKCDFAREHKSSAYSTFIETTLATDFLAHNLIKKVVYDLSDYDGERLAVEMETQFQKMKTTRALAMIAADPTAKIDGVTIAESSKKVIDNYGEAVGAITSALRDDNALTQDELLKKLTKEDGDDSPQLARWNFETVAAKDTPSC